ncbi:MAG: AraC family transcriptional regulator [Tetrasphaera sp.]
MTASPAQSVSEFLGALDFAGARLEFCERFDERSEVWNLTKHRHPFFELIYFVEGRANISAGPDALGIGDFDVVVYPPGLAHLENLEIDRRQDIICLWVDAGPAPVFEHPIAIADRHGSLRHVFELLYAEYAADRPRRRPVIDHCLRLILLLLQQGCEQPAADTDPAFERTLAYVHEYYAEAFTVEELAAEHAVSTSYLYRCYRKRLGMAPMHYRNQVRIEKAKLMLLDPTLPIDTVAGRVGFTDAKYFARVFKQLAGAAPSAYRRDRLASIEAATPVHLSGTPVGGATIPAGLPS